MVSKTLIAMNSIDGYTLQKASDINRDGIGIELLDPTGTLVAEIFRYDTSHRVGVRIFEAEIPLSIFEKYLKIARDRLGSFEDGTPLA